MKVITENYFRDEGEDAIGGTGPAAIENLPVASYGRLNFAESIIASADMPEDTFSGNAEDYSDVEKSWQVWEYLRTQRLTQMTFEDWLRTFGVSLNSVGYEIPELIRSYRTFQYPSNTVTQGTGAVTSAVSWVVQQSANKRRFFNEPGFIVGVQIYRPKVYFANQAGAMAQWMSKITDWMPAITHSQPEQSIREFPDSAAGGPYSDEFGSAYWLDMRDLYMYGDQFIGSSGFVEGVAAASVQQIDQPSTRLTSKYPVEADADLLFSADTDEYIRTDGIVQLEILSKQQDVT